MLLCSMLSNNSKLSSLTNRTASLELACARAMSDARSVLSTRVEPALGGIGGGVVLQAKVTMMFGVVLFLFLFI